MLLETRLSSKCHESTSRREASKAASYIADDPEGNRFHTRGGKSSMWTIAWTMLQWLRCQNKLSSSSLGIYF